MPRWRLLRGADRRPAMSNGVFRRVSKGGLHARREGLREGFRTVLGRLRGVFRNKWSMFPEAVPTGPQRRVPGGIKTPAGGSSFPPSIPSSSPASGSSLSFQLQAPSTASRFGSSISFKAPVRLPLPTGPQASSYDHRGIFEKKMAPIFELQT